MVATAADDAIIHIAVLADRIGAGPRDQRCISTVTSRLLLLLQMLVVLHVAAMAGGLWRSLSNDGLTALRLEPLGYVQLVVER